MAGERARLAVLVLLLAAVLAAAGCIISQTSETPPETRDCDLETDLTSVSIAVGDWESLRVYGYEGGAASISWRSEDTSVATVEPSTGSAITVTGEGTGSTRVIVSDSYAGAGCSVSVSVEVY